MDSKDGTQSESQIRSSEIVLPPSETICCDLCGERIQPNRGRYTWGSYQTLCGLCLDDLGNKYGWSDMTKRQNG